MCREIKIMENLKNGPYILPILDMVKDPASDSPNIVTKWVNTIPYRVAALAIFQSRTSMPV